MDLIALARSAETFVLAARNTLHRIPELRWEERETLEYIQVAMDQARPPMVVARMSQSNVVVRVHGQYTGGLVVDFDVNPNFDRILFRADVDGLPITEATGLPFMSQRPGKMHACGHDIHSAMLLGAFKLCCEHPELLRHNVRFVWQRAEENPITESGGARLVREGVCDGVSAAYGLHIHPMLEAGVFASRPGPMLGNSDRMRVTVKCTGGHVAEPHHGSNAIDIGLDICTSLKGFALRNLGPTEPVSLVPAQFNSGTASNIRPSEATIWFAVRTMLDEDRRVRFHHELEAAVRTIVGTYPDASCEIEMVKGHPTLTNTPEEVSAMASLLRANDQPVETHDILLGGEDFAHYLNATRGCFTMLGAYQDGTGDFHTPNYNPDESVFWKGVLYWLALATADPTN